jgi:hypothetical protein
LRSGQSFPHDQAELLFSDVFVEWLETRSDKEKLSVLVDIEALCKNPVGKHPLSNRGGNDNLAGWNTLDVLAGEFRVVFCSQVVEGVGVIEVLCVGPRKGDAVYASAKALIATGKLTDDEVTEIWQALILLDLLAEDIGLDGWDFKPEPGPDGLVKAAVSAGLLTEDLARLLSKDELSAALEGGWDETGANPEKALSAAMRRARASADPGNIARVMKQRAEDRCGVFMPRKKATCIRKAGHPGPHRSVP